MEAMYRQLVSSSSADSLNRGSNMKSRKRPAAVTKKRPAHGGKSAWGGASNGYAATPYESAASGQARMSGRGIQVSGTDVENKPGRDAGGGGTRRAKSASTRRRRDARGSGSRAASAVRRAHSPVEVARGRSASFSAGAGNVAAGAAVGPDGNGGVALADVLLQLRNSEAARDTAEAQARSLRSMLESAMRRCRELEAENARLHTTLEEAMSVADEASLKADLTSMLRGLTQQTAGAAVPPGSRAGAEGADAGAESAPEATPAGSGGGIAAGERRPVAMKGSPPGSSTGGSGTGGTGSASASPRQKSSGDGGGSGVGEGGDAARSAGDGGGAGGDGDAAAALKSPHPVAFTPSPPPPAGPSAPHQQTPGASPHSQAVAMQLLGSVGDSLWASPSTGSPSSAPGFFSPQPLPMAEDS